MTQATARIVANAVLGAAALGIVVVVLRTPRLRQLARRLAVTGLTTALPAYLLREIQHAWTESGQALASR